MNEVKGEIPLIANLASTTTLTADENEISNVSNLVKEADYNTKISEIEKKVTDHNHDKHFTSPEFNKLTAGKIAARLAQANLESKSDIAKFVKRHFDEN